MKIFCISNSKDTKTGMRLAGIEGIVLNSKEEILNKLNEITKEKKEIGIVLITQNLVKLCEEEILKIKAKFKLPLIVTIPNDDENSNVSGLISKYINDSIGIKI